MVTPKILVVEGNVVEQKLICLLANRFGVDVQVAANAYKAMKLLQEDGSYSAVFMNYMLPAMSGPECALLIRQWALERELRLPIIAVTAAVADEAKSECFEVGMDDYLSKPFTVDQFGQILKRWVVTDEAPV